MTVPASNVSTNLGFLCVQQEPNGFVGGYLVTNAWGRPLEFRLSSAVQPNKVQAILYGDTLPRYLCGEIIGKTLVDKTSTPAQWILVDNAMTLDIRLRVDIPIALWRAPIDADDAAPGLLVQPRIFCHKDYPQDVAKLRESIDKLGSFDFAEPFARIREAMNEARKLGVATRAAA